MTAPTRSQAGRAPAAPAPQPAPAPTRAQGSAAAALRGSSPFLPLAPLRVAPLSGAPDAVSDVLSRDDGVALALPVRSALQESLGIDLAPVRVHQGTSAQSLVRARGARAFALGPHILLGLGERGDDLALMAHEVAHVVQQQGGATVQPLAAGGASDRFEHEAHRVSAAVVGGRPAAVVQRTAPRPQYLFGWARRAASAVAGAVEDAAEWAGEQLKKLLNIAIDFVKEQARRIPGYDMLALILGRDPITQAAVDRSPRNIVKAFMGLWPGGADFYAALDNNGIIDKVGNWVGGQVNALKGVIGGLWDATKTFVSSLGLSDLASPGDVWDRAKKIFSVPVDNAKSFISNLVSDVLTFIRDAILLPIAALAEKTPFYDLLKAVLKKDPVTGAPYPRNPESVIGGFMKMIGKEDIFMNMQKAKALPRGFAWFNKALAELVGFVLQVPTVVINAFQSLTISDMVVVTRAIKKIVVAFATFSAKFISWAGGTIWTLLEIVFDVVSPGALEYIKKTGSAIKDIFRNPIPFMKNLVKAGRLGFDNFAAHFWDHMKKGLIDWLTGSLPGVYIPKSFDLGEIVKFVFSVLGLSWASVREKLVAATSETAVKAMEIGFDIVVTLVRDGPAAAWDKIKSELSTLAGQVVDGIIGMVVEAIVGQAVPKLVAMFIPGAGFIPAILAIYGTVRTVIDKISQIVAVVTAFVDSIVNIAAGNIDGAAKKVENILANGLSLAISFLAGFAGLGKIADKLMGVIMKVRATIDKGIVALIAWVVKMAKSLFSSAFSKNPEDKRSDAQKLADVNKATAEAEALESRPDISEEEIRAGLPAIKKKYTLTSIDLVVDSKDKEKEEVHIALLINPPGSTKKKTIRIDPNAKCKITVPRPGFRDTTKRRFAAQYPDDHVGVDLV